MPFFNLYYACLNWYNVIIIRKAGFNRINKGYWCTDIVHTLYKIIFKMYNISILFEKQGNKNIGNKKKTSQLFYCWKDKEDTRFGQSWLNREYLYRKKSFSVSLLLTNTKCTKQNYNSIFCIESQVFLSFL